MKIYRAVFKKIISLENLFLAWRTFRQDKQKKKDVLEFEWKLETNIFQLHRDLKSHIYTHGAYTSFYIQDPKQRHIHKATVRDRVLHHAVFAVLNPLFERAFIAHSFSCRVGKGTHKGVETLGRALLTVSKNFTKPCFALKCDIRKFFETVHHDILLGILGKRVKDKDTMWLLKEIIESFVSQYSTLFERRGVPIGNLTSQLFANIYLNEFDQFMKHELHIQHYLRYTDDFIIVSRDKAYLQNLIPRIRSYLSEKLSLELHPKKVSIRKFHQGVDFLGYLNLHHHGLLRSTTRQRIFRKLRYRINQYKNGAISKKTLEQALQSYLGVLSHADAYELQQKLTNQFWFWLNE